MKFSLFGHHARVVTLGWMAKGKGFSSRTSLLISEKILVGNVVTIVNHTRAVSLDYLLNKKKKEKAIKNEITKRIKGINGLGKNCIHDRYNSPSTKAPTGNIFSSLAHTVPTCLDIP